MKSQEETEQGNDDLRKDCVPGAFLTPVIRTRIPHSIKVSEGIESIIKDIRKLACRNLETKLNQITQLVWIVKI